MYLQAKEKSSQTSVSAFSESESVSLLKKWDGYFLLLYASAKFAHTDLEDFLI